MQKGELDRALADLNEAARIDSSNFYAFWNRGAVYAAKGDFDRAQEDFTKALALNPDKSFEGKIEEALNAVTAGVESAANDRSRRSVGHQRSVDLRGTDQEEAPGRPPRASRPTRHAGFPPPMAIQPAIPAGATRRCRSGRRASYRFLNSGFRFSMKAAMPSFWSSVANSE